MASKYLQKYPVPPGFNEILHDFAREILRAQPDDILDFAANYFEHKNKGEEYYYESKFNVKPKKDGDKKTYNPVPYQELSNKAKNVVQKSNETAKGAQQKVDSQDSQRPSSREQAQKHSRKNQKSDENIRQQTDKSEDHNNSKMSHPSSATTHPEEKQMTREFMGNLYSSAIGKATNDQMGGGEEAFQRSSSRNREHDEEKEDKVNKSLDTTHPEEKNIGRQEFQNLTESALRKSMQGDMADQKEFQFFEQQAQQQEQQLEEDEEEGFDLFGGGNEQDEEEEDQ